MSQKLSPVDHCIAIWKTLSEYERGVFDGATRDFVRANTTEESRPVGRPKGSKSKPKAAKEPELFTTYTPNAATEAGL